MQPSIKKTALCFEKSEKVSAAFAQKYTKDKQDETYLLKAKCTTTTTTTTRNSEIRQ